MVNELRVGITAKGGASYFGDRLQQWTGRHSRIRAATPSTSTPTIGLTNWFTSNAPSWRSAPTYSIENSLTWQKGAHSFTAGAAWLSSRVWSNSQQMVPGINLGFDTDSRPRRRPCSLVGRRRTRISPGASTAQLNDARALYALLTGRVGSITGEATLDPDDEQIHPVRSTFAARQDRHVLGLHSGHLALDPDAHASPAGCAMTCRCRFRVQRHPHVRSRWRSACGISGIGGGGVYDRCNFFVQGVQPGAVVPQFDQLTSGTLGYNTDWNNFAPSAQIAWRPNVQSGFMRALLGDPEQATLRAGYSVAYERQGLAEFLDVFGANPGSSVSLTNAPRPGLGQDGLAGSVQSARIGSTDPAVPGDAGVSRSPIQSGRGSDLFAFAPDIKIGQAHTWTVGFQRSITQRHGDRGTLCRHLRQGPVVDAGLQRDPR